MPFYHQSVKGKHPVQHKCVLTFHGLPHGEWWRAGHYIIACGKTLFLNNIWSMPSISLTSGSKGGVLQEMENACISSISAAVFKCICEWQWKWRSAGMLMVVQKKSDCFLMLSNLCFNMLVRPVRRLIVAAGESQPVCPIQSWHHVMCSHVGICASTRFSASLFL